MSRKKVNYFRLTDDDNSSMQLVVDNSFCKINGVISPDAEQLLKQVMTYKNDIDAEKGQLFYQLKMAGKYGNNQKYHAIKARIRYLEENEYVCLYKNSQFPTGLLNIAYEALTALQVPFQMVDTRQQPGETTILRWNNPPWEPRYYQKEMIDLGLKAGRGVFEAAVGSGKSLVMAYLIKHLSCTSLIIVPSRGLSDQLYNDFCSWFGYQSVQLLDAAKIRKIKKPKPISIVTVQSLASLVKSGEFKDFAKHIDAVYYDEFHHSASTSYTALQEDLSHVYYRFGFTGTFMRNDNKTLEMWGVLSNVLYEYPAWRAIEEGFLTPMEVLVHNLPGAPNIKYQTEYDNSYCGNPALLERIAQIINNVSSNDQILILCNKKDKAGLIVYEYLNSIGISASYISGDDTKEDISQTIVEFNEKRIRILIGTAVISEGIDIRSTDHLINIKGGKSEIVLTQAMGRAIRKFEGKETAYVHDFRFDGTKYMEKHLEHRLDAITKNFKPKAISET